MPHYVQIGWMGSKCKAKMLFVGLNFVDDFGPLAESRHLEF